MSWGTSTFFYMMEQFVSHGGTSTFFNMMEQCVSMGVPAHNLKLLMVPKAQHKPMVDQIVTFKLSLAMGVRHRMVQFDRTILTYG